MNYNHSLLYKVFNFELMNLWSDSGRKWALEAETKPEKWKTSASIGPKDVQSVQFELN